MLRFWNSITKRWESADPFCYAESDERTGKGDGADGTDGKGGDASGGSQDPAKLAAENAALKAQLAAVGPRLKAIEDADKKAADARSKADDDRKKKELGADAVIKEKDEKLRTAEDRLASLEKRARERIDAQFAALPEQVREVIGELKDKLQLDDWETLVGKHSLLAAESTSTTDEEKKMGLFIKPGGTGGGKYELKQKTREILDSLAVQYDPNEVNHRVVTRVRDDESGAVTTRFTKQVKTFFGDMTKYPQAWVQMRK